MRGYDHHKAIWDETPSGKMLEHVDKSLTLAIMEHTHIIYLYIYTLKLTVYNFLLGDSTAEKNAVHGNSSRIKITAAFALAPQTRPQSIINRM